MVTQEKVPDPVMDGSVIRQYALVNARCLKIIGTPARSGVTMPETSQETDREWHARLLAGDPTATADLLARHYEPLIAWMVACNPRLDEHDCVTAAHDAILSLCKRPTSYKPERSPLVAYLRMSARGDLRNSRERERRHQGRDVAMETVELSPDAGKYLQDADADPERVLLRMETVRTMIDAQPAIPEVVRAALTPGEARALALMRQGERRTDAYARSLGLAHLPVAEQRREVKRVKDRLHKRLERAGGDDGRAP